MPTDARVVVPADEVYRQRAETHAVAEQRYADRSRLISYLRIGTFLAGAGCVIVAAFATALPARPLYAAAGAFFAAFAGLVAYHATIERRQRHHAVLAGINVGALDRVRRDWSAIPVPDIGAPAAHAYAEDLDLFGRASLFALLWSGGTAMAQQRLADWLQRPALPPEVEARQRAVDELAPLLDLRQDLLAAARTGKLHTHDVPRFLAWAEGRPWLSPHRLAVWAIRALTAAILGLVVLQAAAVVPHPYWLLPAVLAFVISNFTAVRLEHLFDAAFSHYEVFTHYTELLRLVSSARVESPLLKQLQEALTAETVTAHQHIARLAQLMRLADLRRSALVHLPVQVLTLWDFHVVLLVERWQQHAGASARRWFDALATFEALAALAALRYDNPGWAFPDVDRRHDTYDAAALGHPLLAAASRVANDVKVGPGGTFLLVTGSNMSGKSTLLRAIGLNAVLAQAGAPVCAQALRMPPVRLQTSMRVQDSLEEGVSFFMAAVKRLKQVVEAADRPERAGGEPALLLYLLDEVLQGTNTAERQVAVRSILRHLLARPAIGAVTTHDLALADTPDLSAAAHAVHFTEHFETSGGRRSMTFDYRLRPGIATSQNAIKLMQLVGLEVDDQPAR